MPFDSAGEADHCAALRLIPASALRVLQRVLLLMLRRVLLLMSRRTVILRISVSLIIGRRLRRIAGLRRWQRVSLFAVELVGGFWLLVMLSSRRVLLGWILLRVYLLPRLVLSGWSHGFGFCSVLVRLEGGILDGFSVV